MKIRGNERTGGRKTDPRNIRKIGKNFPIKVTFKATSGRSAKLLERGENSLNYLNSRYREDRTAITSDRSANFNTSSLAPSLSPSVSTPFARRMYVPPRWSPALVCVTPSRVRTRGWTFGVACRRGGLFRWTRVCARTTARMYLTLEYSRHPLSPGVAGMEEGGGGEGARGREGEREREEKKKEGVVSAQQEARCSADKRIFRLTTRDHILQLMRLDLTLRYFSPAFLEKASSLLPLLREYSTC